MLATLTPLGIALRNTRVNTTYFETRFGNICDTHKAASDLGQYCLIIVISTQNAINCKYPPDNPKNRKGLIQKIKTIKLMC